MVSTLRPAARCGSRKLVLAAASVASSGAAPRTRRWCMPLFPMPPQRLPSLEAWSHFRIDDGKQVWRASIRPRARVQLGY